MALPPTVRVKLSSEAAESISITPVVLQEMPVGELVEHMLGVTGKDEARIAELLLRGSLVSGASRFRWAGWQTTPEDVRELLATFPDPDPARAFHAPDCVRATLRGGRQPIEITRHSGEKKGLFQRDTFWDSLMRVVSAAPPVYASYSYHERCDRYIRDFTPSEVEQLRAAGHLLRYTSLTEQIRTQPFTNAELLAKRVG